MILRVVVVVPIHARGREQVSILEVGVCQDAFLPRGQLACRAIGDDCGGQLLAYSLDGCQTCENLAIMNGPVLHAVIAVEGYVANLAFVDDLTQQSLGLVFVLGVPERGTGKLQRVVRLEPCAPVGDDRIGDRVRAVEDGVLRLAELQLALPVCDVGQGVAYLLDSPLPVVQRLAIRVEGGGADQEAAARGRLRHPLNGLGDELAARRAFLLAEALRVEEVRCERHDQPSSSSSPWRASRMSS